MKIRYATIDDVDIVTDIEAQSFSVSERASRESMKGRLERFSEGFWLLEENGEVRAFINGIYSDEKELCDDMFHNPETHYPYGKWLMVLSVATLPVHRHKGFASKLMNRVIEDVKSQGKDGLVLTCKESLLKFYSSFGFENEGVSSSTHGGAVWYQMRLSFR